MFVKIKARRFDLRFALFPSDKILTALVQTDQMILSLKKAIAKTYCWSIVHDRGVVIRHPQGHARIPVDLCELELIWSNILLDNVHVSVSVGARLLVIEPQRVPDLVRNDTRLQGNERTGE